MSNIVSSALAFARWPLLLLVFLNAASCHLGRPGPGATGHANREELVGAWQLASIQIEGPNGTTADPFYNADATGILIYDASGWMSVQIVGQPRPPMEAAAARPARTDPPEDARLKATLFDTYYAYFGTWDYDQASSTVTHHVKSSLISGETGVSYTQTVALSAGELIFTTRQEAAGSTVVRKKIWKRIEGPAAE